MIRKKAKPRDSRPIIQVRKVGTEWQAKCPPPCGRRFTDARSEKALSACVQHAYGSHRWSKHEVKFH